MKRILTVVVACLAGFVLFPCAGLAQSNDQASKAIRRTSSDSGTSSKEQKRIALVIGNSAYKDVPLRNPARDAQDISNVLQGLGFTVQTKINANNRQMDEAVNEFIQKVRNGDVALFYFSGHGVQVKGENYLIPVGGKIASEADVHYASVNVGRILANLEESRNRINIVILDACRNNPFKGFRSYGKGLSPVDAPVGTFIAYATSPGSVAADGTGANSPYTKHLLEALKTEGTSIENVFKRVLRAVRAETGGKQTPWYSSCLPDDFYFRPRAGISPQPASPSRERPQTPPVAGPEPPKPAAIPPAVKRDPSKDAALISAALVNKFADVKRLLSEGADVNARDEYENTALMRAAQRSRCDPALVTLLLDNGADVNAKNNWGYTPLMDAATYGCTECAKVFLAKGASVNEKNVQGFTPLMMAAYMSNVAMVEMLLKKGADVAAKDAHGQTALLLASNSERAQAQIVALLKQHGAKVEYSENKDMALIQASSIGDISTVQRLLASGANVNASDHHGYTALMRSSHHGHTEIAQLLIGKGADLNIKRKDGHTALWGAVFWGWTKIVSLLLEKGANVNEKDSRGESLLKLSQKRGYKEIEALLRKHGAN